MGIRHNPSNPPQENVAQVPLFPILLINFIGSLGFSIVLPFLVFLVTRLGGNAFVYGLMGAAYPAFQLVGAPILGRWSDIYGRRRILLLSQIGTLVSWVMFLIALFLPATPIFRADPGVFGSFVLTLPLLVLFLGRALDGITGGNVSVANAYLADITKEDDRSENFGKMAISSNLGFIIGPALGGLLGATVYGELLPVLAALLISLAGTFIIYFRLSESRPCVIERDPEQVNVRKVFGQEQKECYFPEGSKDVRVKEVLLLERIPYMLLLIFLIFLGFNVFYTAFPVHAIENLEWSTTELGIYISVLSGMMVVVQGPVLGRLSKRYSDSVLIVVGSAVLGTNFLLLAGGDVVLTYFAAVFFALGNGLMWPSVLSHLSKLAGQAHQGAVQGLANSSGSLASIGGLIIGGILFGALGSMTFLVAAGVIYAAFVLSFRLL